MQYATLQGEKTVADLVNRLYQLPNASQLSTTLTQNPAATKALVAQAADALQRANPALTDLSKIPPNMVIVVPPVSGLNPTAAALVAGTPVETRIANIRTAVTASLTTLNASATSQLNQLTALQTALDTDPDWKALIAAFPDAKNALAATHAATDQRIAGLKSMLDMQSQVKTQLEADLKELEPVG